MPESPAYGRWRSLNHMLRWDSQEAFQESASAPIPREPEGFASIFLERDANFLRLEDFYGIMWDPLFGAFGITVEAS